MGEVEVFDLGDVLELCGEFEEFIWWCVDVEGGFVGVLDAERFFVVDEPGDHLVGFGVDVGVKDGSFGHGVL